MVGLEKVEWLQLGVSVCGEGSEFVYVLFAVILLAALFPLVKTKWIPFEGFFRGSYMLKYVGNVSFFTSFFSLKKDKGFYARTITGYKVMMAPTDPE